MELEPEQGGGAPFAKGRWTSCGRTSRRWSTVVDGGRETWWTTLGGHGGRPLLSTTNGIGGHGHHDGGGKGGKGGKGGRGGHGGEHGGPSLAMEPNLGMGGDGGMQ